MSDTFDTDWTRSNKGNQWRRLHGRLLVVGESKFGIWARVADTFVKGRFSDTAAAKIAAEREATTASMLHGFWLDDRETR